MKHLILIAGLLVLSVGGCDLIRKDPGSWAVGSLHPFQPSRAADAENDRLRNEIATMEARTETVKAETVRDQSQIDSLQADRTARTEYRNLIIRLTAARGRIPAADVQPIKDARNTARDHKDAMDKARDEGRNETADARRTDLVAANAQLRFWADKY